MTIDPAGERMWGLDNGGGVYRLDVPLPSAPSLGPRWLFALVFLTGTGGGLLVQHRTA